MYKKIKRQNGETFARTLRDHHNGLLEIPDIDKIVRHAGRDAEPLLPYLMSLLATNDDTPTTDTLDPFVLLDRAGYDAFYADTLEKQNSIAHYFKGNERLCTFNDHARHKNYYIVHAVKKNVDSILRAAFNGKEQRQDEYGTSVISIQISKNGHFISIKNRYNHTVKGCDHTFGSNPNNIIPGLSAALKAHFNVDFSSSDSPLPDEYALMNEHVFKYNFEENNIYYGDQAWAKDGVIHTVNKSDGDALFDGFLFDNKTKTLKKIDPDYNDSFADDFNHYYGGNKGLTVKNGNLMLDGEVLIGAENSRIKTLYLPGVTELSDYFLETARDLIELNAPDLLYTGNYCLCRVHALTELNAPALTKIGDSCFFHANTLTELNAPDLLHMGNSCFYYADALTTFNAPNLTQMDDRCLSSSYALTIFNAPALTQMGKGCLSYVDALTIFNAPALTQMGDDCFSRTKALTTFNVPALTQMGNACFGNAQGLITFNAPALTQMGHNCFFDAQALTTFNAPALAQMGHNCFFDAQALTTFNAPALAQMGHSCFLKTRALTKFNTAAFKLSQDRGIIVYKTIYKLSPRRLIRQMF